MPNHFNNETLGVTAQVTICQLAKIKIPPEFESRANASLAETLRPVLAKTLKKLPSLPSVFKTIDQIQEQARKRTHVNFELRNGKTLSIKTNLNGSKQAANVIGQCGNDTFTFYFGHLFSNKISKDIFKCLVIS